MTTETTELAGYESRKKSIRRHAVLDFAQCVRGASLRYGCPDYELRVFGADGETEIGTFCGAEEPWRTPDGVAAGQGRDAKRSRDEAMSALVVTVCAIGIAVIVALAIVFLR